MSRTRAGVPLRQRFGQHLEREQLIAPDAHVMVALSAGLDSTVLLHLLRFSDVGLTISAAHFDHALRDDSAADAQWAAGLCRAWNVPLTIRRTGEPPRSESMAREQRYAFLHRAARETGATLIATAHHADDQAETVLLRLARGTGTGGLIGIPQRRGVIVRPLLPFARAELAAYARENRIAWRDDATNADLQYARNRVRHTVLPALEAAYPGATRNIAALAARAADAEGAWDDVVDTVIADTLTARSAASFTLARERLLAYHPHVRARVLRRLMAQLGRRPDSVGTRLAVQFISSGESGSRLEAGGGVTLECEFDRLVIVGPDAPRTGVDTDVVIESVRPGSGVFIAGGRKHEVRWGPSSQVGWSRCTANFDPSSLQFPLLLRAWRPGDRIRLDYGHKKLKKLFQERRLGRRRRGGVPVLADAAGRVLWVPGVARSAHSQPLENAGFTVMVGDGDTV